MSVLVVAAHPDDEVLGCGGTLARLAREGKECFIAILGEGITSRYGPREDANPETVAALRTDSRRAADLLGAKDLFQYDLPDNRFDTLPLLEVIKIVEGLIERVRPESVYTHHGGDLNVDHRVLHRAVLTATRPLPGQVVRRVYAFEVPSSTEWSFGQLAPVFQPNVFVDIAATLETKIRAMQCYESESREFPHSRSPESLRAIAQRWGSVAGLQAAEAFVLIRAIE